MSAKFLCQPLLAVALLLLCGIAPAQPSASSGTAPFILDGNRMYAELSFIRPDGSVHRALAFVDTGSPSVEVKQSLFEELQIDQAQPLILRIGDLPLRIPAAEVASEPGEPRAMGPELKVEAVLPAGLLQKYQVVMDYQKRTLTLTSSGTLKPEGISVPFQINPQTGLIAVDASINGHSYAVTIDNGSAYTWLRQSTAKDWLAAHPDWQRGVGAVGVSNMMMEGDTAETDGILLRIPEISIGPLRLNHVGVLGVASSKNFPGNLELFDWYSKKNPLPVIGWLGGNVLKNFRLTIDYPNRRMYWLQQTPPVFHDLDQVGLTLKLEDGKFLVAGIASKNGKPTVEGVQPGDQLIQIGAMETKHATWGAIYGAMHGKSGEVRVLTLLRGTQQITVRARVTSF